jgi:outer membrane protein assembly factor BamA
VKNNQQVKFLLVLVLVLMVLLYQEELNEKNFLGKGINVNSILILVRKKYLAQFLIVNPDFKNSGNTLNTSIFAENNDYDNASYENKVIGSSISLLL